MGMPSGMDKNVHEVAQDHYGGDFQVPAKASLAETTAAAGKNSGYHLGVTTLWT